MLCLLVLKTDFTSPICVSVLPKNSTNCYKISFLATFNVSTPKMKFDGMRRIAFQKIDIFCDGTQNSKMVPKKLVWPNAMHFTPFSPQNSQYWPILRAGPRPNALQTRLDLPPISKIFSNNTKIVLKRINDFSEIPYQHETAQYSSKRWNILSAHANNLSWCVAASELV